MKSKQLIKILTNLNYKIASAESCTGGLFISSLIGVNNSSKVINESYVTYASESKIKILNVDPKTIETYTVYSEEVAKEMAIGVSKLSNADVGVGITGIAGPLGGTKEKPVGTVCFGIYLKNEDKLYSFTKIFKIKNRNIIRKSACRYLTNKLIEILK